MDARTIVVLEGDETGQELLEEALRVLAPDVVGVENPQGLLEQLLAGLVSLQHDDAHGHQATASRPSSPSASA